MSTPANELEILATQDYKYGFVTDIEADAAPPGLNEDIVRWISAKKEEPEFMLEWRLKAFRHWTTMTEPDWHNVRYTPIDYQSIVYYSAPKSGKDGPKSLDEVDPELLETYEKLGIPLSEREALAGVAVDAVFDSVSVATTFKEKLGEMGVIFCPFSEAVREHPELVEKYLGSVVPYTDNFFATLNSAVFSDGSFCFIPKGRAMSDGAVHVLPDQRRQHRPVRAHANHRRKGQLRQLSGGLYGAHAGRKPVARRSRRIGSARRRSDQVLDRPELVSRRQGR